jgi:hypothetical protein
MCVLTVVDSEEPHIQCTRVHTALTGRKHLWRCYFVLTAVDSEQPHIHCMTVHSALAGRWHLWRCTFQCLVTYSRSHLVSLQYQKFSFATGHEGPGGETRYNSTLSLTSALYWGEWLKPRSGRFTHFTGDCVGSRAILDGYGKSRPHWGPNSESSRPWLVTTQTTLSRLSWLRLIHIYI